MHNSSPPKPVQNISLICHSPLTLSTSSASLQGGSSAYSGAGLIQKSIICGILVHVTLLPLPRHVIWRDVNQWFPVLPTSSSEIVMRTII